MRPALIVVGIALGLLIVFSILAITGDAPSTPTNVVSNTPAAVSGSSLLAVPANQALRGIEGGGQPPANVLDALRVPQGTNVLSSANNYGTQYDEQVELYVAADQADVIAFYKTILSKGVFHLLSSGPARNLPGGIEVLGRIAGTDGWYWDVGATVKPSTFVGAADHTTFSLRLVQVPDED
jgi:hypothetical protein